MGKTAADESAAPVSDGANSWAILEPANGEYPSDNEFVLEADGKCHFTCKVSNFGKAGYTPLAEWEKIMVEGPGQGPPVKACGHGYVYFEKFKVEAYYAPESGANKLSVPLLGKDLDYSVEFTRDGYTVRDMSCADDDDDDGTAAAAAKIVCQGGVNSDGSYTIDAIV